MASISSSLFNQTAKWLFTGVAFVLCSCLIHGCTTSAQPASPPAVQAMPVQLQTVRAHIMDDSSNFVATLKSRKSVNLKPQIEGRVLEILVKSGDHVRAGQPVMILDKSKQEAMVSGNEAAIETAVAEEKNAIAMVKSLKASRLSKVANLEFAQTQYRRYKELSQEGAVAAESVDEKRNALGVCQAELEAIDAQINAQEAQVARAQKSIKVAQASKLEQVEQLKYFTVKSPFEGMIGDVPVKLGDYVTTDTMLTTVDQTKPLEVYINVPTTLSPRLRIGLPVELIDEHEQRIETAKVFFISSQVESGQQTVLAKAELPNLSGRLRSGQTSNSKIVWDEVSAVTIPVTAVSRFSGQDFVFVAEDKGGKLTASQRAVSLGPIKDNEYRVISGVQSGDRLVTSGIQNLSDGAPISEAPAAAAAAKKPAS